MVQTCGGLVRVAWHRDVPLAPAAMMVSQGGPPPNGGSILRAGSIDLLKRMKEGLIEPLRIANCREVPALYAITEGKKSRKTAVPFGFAPWPRLMPGKQMVLKGRLMDETSTGQAAEAAQDGAAPLGENGCRVPLVSALIRRAVLKTAGLA